MPKSKVVKTKEIITKLPIQVKLSINKVTKDYTTDNLLNFFRDLKVNTNEIHFRTLVEVTFNGKTLKKNYTIGQFRAILAKEFNRIVCMKYFTTFLNIK
jgi:hypothetical protein